MEAGMQALLRVDELVAGLLESVTDDLSIVLASDHGNLEDVRVGHTLNPAVGLFIGGRHHELSAPAASLMDVAPSILNLAQSQ
jgi:bisphosphoglycerate-independent phosphoglycerate mutase (AlkP superfamily)